MQMSKVVAQSASRALGLLTDKYFGGMCYKCFTKCYDATVQSVIEYSAAIWGSITFSFISAVHLEVQIEKKKSLQR